MLDLAVYKMTLRMQVGLVQGSIYVGFNFFIFLPTPTIFAACLRVDSIFHFPLFAQCETAVAFPLPWVLPTTNRVFMRLQVHLLVIRPRVCNVCVTVTYTVILQTSKDQRNLQSVYLMKQLFILAIAVHEVVYTSHRTLRVETLCADFF